MGNYRAQERRSEGRGPPRRDFRRPDGPLKLYDTICARCGKKTQVPFLPRGGKPVYCRDCFVKPEGASDSRRESRSEAPSSSRPGQLEQINAKLDKIMKALDIE